MKCPDFDLSLTFYSIPQRRKADGWRVRLTFPANAAEGDDLLLESFDGEDRPLDGGAFHFAGGVWRFRGGRSQMPYAAFIKGIHERAVWFTRPGGSPIPGVLTFG